MAEGCSYPKTPSAMTRLLKRLVGYGNAFDTPKIPKYRRCARRDRLLWTRE